jgi:hypothetical protein
MINLTNMTKKVIKKMTKKIALKGINMNFITQIKKIIKNLTMNMTIGKLNKSTIKNKNNKKKNINNL